MSHSFMLTAEENLILPHSLLQQYGTKQFSIVATDDMIVLEPEQHEPERITLTPEEDRRLRDSVARVQRSEVKPVAELKKLA